MKVLLTTLLLLVACTPTPHSSVKEVTEVTIPAEASETPVSVKKKKITQLNIDPEQVILFNAEVDYNSVSLAKNQITSLSKEYKDLYLYIDSPGGSVFDGNILVSHIEGTKARIHTVCVGLCASMAAQIFSHGHKRYLVDRSVLMFHQASGGVRGNIKGMKSLLTFIDREVRKLDAYVANRAGMTPEAFDRLVENDFWVAADDALELKLADEIVHLSVELDNQQTFNIREELKKRNIQTKSLVTTTNPLTEMY